MLSEVLKWFFLRLSTYYVVCEIAMGRIESILLRSAKSGWNNVGELEIVFKRAWLVAVVPCN